MDDVASKTEQALPRSIGRRRSTPSASPRLPPCCRVIVNKNANRDRTSPTTYVQGECSYRRVGEEAEEKEGAEEEEIQCRPIAVLIDPSHRRAEEEEKEEEAAEEEEDIQHGSSACSQYPLP